MLSDLDPYTVYLVDDQKSGLDMLTSGQYGGVGIQIGKRDNVITVIAPTDDSPAKRAGIMAGDVLIKIDGKNTESMSMDDAAKLIRGKKGSSVVLTIERFNEDDPIKINSLSLKAFCLILKDVLDIEIILDFISIWSSSLAGFLYSILQDFTIIKIPFSSNNFLLLKPISAIASVLALSKNFK